MMLADIQKAVTQRLMAYEPLTDLLARDVDDSAYPGVYDHVPQSVTPEDDTPFPFLTIDDFVGPWDTDTEKGFDVEVTLHAWTRHGGRWQAKVIQDACYDAFHRMEGELSIDGANIVLVHYLNSEVLQESDGRTYRGIQTIQMLVEVEP